MQRELSSNEVQFLAKHLLQAVEKAAAVPTALSGVHTEPWGSFCTALTLAQNATRNRTAPQPLADAITALESQRSTWGQAGDGWRKESRKAIELLAGIIGRSPNVNESLREKVLDTLTPQQGRIVEYLWREKTASYDTIAMIPRAFQDVPSDDAIKQAVKRANRKLCEENLPVSITVSSSKRRLTLETP